MTTKKKIEFVRKVSAELPIELALGATVQFEFLYQLSDIHIQPIRRHAEYRAVFNRVYQQLRASPPGLIVLTGDIVDAKIKVTNELLIFLNEFLSNLAAIMPVVLIAGNHDLNIREQNRIDTLLGALLMSEIEPNIDYDQVLKTIEKTGYLMGKHCRVDNLVYLRRSGGYRIGNLVFGLSSFLDDQVYRARQIIKPPGVDYIIGLAHLSLYEARYSTGIRHSSRKYTVDTFRGYDFVLLGDIHQAQFMNREQTIGYPGSLLQINFGEPLTGHGYLKWDLKAGLGHLIPVKNNQGFLKLRFEAGELVDRQQVLRELAEVEAVSLRIYHDLKTSRAVVDKFLNDLPSLGVQVLDYKRIADRIPLGEVIGKTTETAVEEAKNKMEFENLYQLETQINYLRSYLEQKHIDANQIEAILNIHRDYHKAIQNDSLSETGRVNDFEWKLKCLKFENIFCYRGPNLIDFSQLHGLIGILGNNSLGKSTIMDIILFAIFNKCDRVDLNNRADLLTKGINSGWIELTIQEKANQELIFFLEVKRQVNGNVRMNRSYFRRMIDIDSKSENVIQIGGNGEVTKMASLFGDYQTFVMVHVKLQSNVGEMGSAGAREQHTILHRLLKLDCFKAMSVQVGQELTELRRSLKSGPGVVDLSAIKAELTKKQGDLETISKHQANLETELNNDRLVIEQLHQEKSQRSRVVRSDAEIAVKEKAIGIRSKIDILNQQLIGVERTEIDPVECPSESELTVLIELERVFTIGYDEIEIGLVNNLDKDLDKALDSVYRSLNNPNIKLILDKIKVLLNEYITEYSQLEIETNNVKGQTDILASNLVKNVGKLELVHGLNYAANCKVCQSNHTWTTACLMTEEAIKKTEHLIKLGGNAPLSSEKLTNIIESLNENMKHGLDLVKTTYNDRKRCFEKAQRHREWQTNLTKFQTLDQLRIELEPLEKDLAAIDKRLAQREREQKQWTVEWQNRMDLAQACLSERQSEFKETAVVYRELIGRVIWLETEVERNRVWQTEHQRLENRLVLLKQYQEAIGERGILKTVVEEKLGLMTNMINDIVQSMNPRAAIEIDYDENGFQLMMIKSGHRHHYKILGGFEKFLVNLALKIALSNVSNVSKPNFVCIDEGWGSADHNHRHNLDLFLETLAERYEMILIVSHIPELVDILENNCLPIYEREDGGSPTGLSKEQISSSRGTGSYINNTNCPVADIKPSVDRPTFSGRDRSIEHDDVKDSRLKKPGESRSNRARKTMEIKIV